MSLEFREASIERYLARLSQNLGDLDETERQDVINELRSHLIDALDSSDDTSLEIDQIMGHPEQLARQIRATQMVNRASNLLSKFWGFVIVSSTALPLGIVISTVIFMLYLFSAGLIVGAIAAMVTQPDIQLTLWTNVSPWVGYVFLLFIGILLFALASVLVAATYRACKKVISRTVSLLGEANL